LNTKDSREDEKLALLSTSALGFTSTLRSVPIFSSLVFKVCFYLWTSSPLPGLPS